MLEMKTFSIIIDIMTSASTLMLRDRDDDDEKSATAEEKKKLADVKLELQRKEVEMRNVEDVLPRRPGLYLRIVLGALNISLSSKQDKFAYKNDYEQFKIVVSAICAVLTFLLYFFIQSRVLDTVFHFLLVWYYCTLTIRERILIANGSRIKGWWNIYHFISTASAGIMLIWPRSQSYDEFRDQFMLFSLCMSIVHCFQYQYQIGCLYKLRALGEIHPMYITIDGFKSWMFKRLTFILPFLYGVYAFEMYNAYCLYEISRQPYCQEWQSDLIARDLMIIQKSSSWTPGFRNLRSCWFPTSVLCFRIGMLTQQRRTLSSSLHLIIRSPPKKKPSQVFLRFSSVQLSNYKLYIKLQWFKPLQFHALRVLAVAFLDAIRAMGNLITMGLVVRQKFRSISAVEFYRLKSQYHFSQPSKGSSGDESVFAVSKGDVIESSLLPPDETCVVQRQPAADS
ncbi:transmembrane protein 120B [Clonorchis sinensis]|uniref:Transmembrane protein 120B n=1 Tax=Clonorchis sinensis TaxID=79923 RepID=G7YUA6_CLOSI|nr:transmembrane protein 120B [Clonorchis sinensis]